MIFKEVNLILACLFDFAFHGAGLLPRCRLSDRFLISSPIKFPHASSSGPTRILSHSLIPLGRILYHFPHLRGFPLGMRHLFIATSPHTNDYNACTAPCAPWLFLIVSAGLVSKTSLATYFRLDV